MHCALTGLPSFTHLFKAGNNPPFSPTIAIAVLSYFKKAYENNHFSPTKAQFLLTPPGHMIPSISSKS